MSSKVNQIKIMKKDGNVEMKDTMKRIMDNQEKAQSSLVSIVDAMFEMAGLNGPSFENKRFKAATEFTCTETFVKDYLEMQKNDKEKFNTSMQRNFNGLDFVVTVYEDVVNNFNANATEQEKQSLFLQCLLALAYVNYTDRLGFINMLMKQSVESQSKIEKGRSFTLASMLMIPEFAA